MISGYSITEEAAQEGMIAVFSSNPERGEYELKRGFDGEFVLVGSTETIAVFSYNEITIIGKRTRSVPIRKRSKDEQIEFYASQLRNETFKRIDTERELEKALKAIEQIRELAQQGQYIRIYGVIDSVTKNDES